MKESVNKIEHLRHRARAVALPPSVPRGAFGGAKGISRQEWLIARGPSRRPGHCPSGRPYRQHPAHPLKMPPLSTAAAEWGHYADPGVSGFSRRIGAGFRKAGSGAMRRSETRGSLPAVIRGAPIAVVSGKGSRGTRPSYRRSFPRDRAKHPRRGSPGLRASSPDLPRS